MLSKLAAILVLSAVAQAQATMFCTADATGACPCATPPGSQNGCPNSANFSGAYLTTFDPASVSNDVFVLRASGLPTNAVALIVQGTWFVQTGPAPFGDGVRCIAGSMMRVALVQANAGAFNYPEPGQPPISVRGQIPAAGGYRNYQVWYRDPMPFCTSATFNLTNAVGVTWTP